MKKIILTVATVFAFSVANAQEITSSKGENYLPEKGEWSIGFKASNLWGNNVNNRYAGFVGKRMDSDKTATRIVADFTVGITSLSGTPKVTPGTYTPPPTPGNPAPTPIITNTTETTDTSSNSIQILAGLGKEWRRGKTRLQGYYGFDGFVTLKPFSSLNVDTKEVTRDLDNNIISTSTRTTETSGGFSVGIGARGFIGGEYFIAPKVAVGAEYNYTVNLGYTGGSETTTKETTVKEGVTTVASPVKLEKDSNFNASLGNVGVVALTLSLYF